MKCEKCGKDVPIGAVKCTHRSLFRNYNKGVEVFMKTSKVKIISLVVVAVLTITLSSCSNRMETESGSSKNQSTYSSAVRDTIEGEYSNAVSKFNPKLLKIK